MLQPSASPGLQRPATAASGTPAASRRSDPDSSPLLSLGNVPRPPSGNVAAVGRASGLAPYSMALDQAQLLVALLGRYRRALDPDYALPLDLDQQRAVDTFYAKRTALLGMALREVNPSPSSTHAAPALDDCRVPAEVFQRLLAGSSGLVVGTPHAGAAAKQVLIDTMGTLRRLGVDTLYLDKVQSDVHQPDLDVLYHSGRMPPALDRFLAHVDYDPMLEPAVASGGTYRALVDAATGAGVRVVALDLLTSFHLRGADALEDVRRQGHPDIRPPLFNYVATMRIQEHRRSLPPVPGQRRWLALVDAKCAGDLNGNAGLAARLDVPSLLVQGVPCGGDETVRAGHDPGRALPQDATNMGGELQCGYLLKVPQRGGRRPSEAAEPCSAEQARAARTLRATINGCAQRLDRIGTCQLLTLDSGGHLLVHRSGDRSLVAQRIERADGGGLRLQLAATSDPQRWSVLDREFSDLTAFCAALDTLLERVADTSPPRSAE